MIFDLFGTLVPAITRRECRQVLAQMAAQVGAPEQDFARAWFDIGASRATGALPTTEASIAHIGQRLG